MKGKEKCKALKEIRRQIAENNDIKYVVEECQHKGECRGTCPRCEAEVRYLERELERRRNLGKKVALAGVSLSVAASFSACSPATVVNTVYDAISDALFDSGNIDYAGDIQYVPDTPDTPAIDTNLDGDVAEDDYPMMGEPEAPIEVYDNDDYVLDGGAEYIPEDELAGSTEILNIDDEDCYDNCNDENDCDDSECDNEDCENLPEAVNE